MSDLKQITKEICIKNEIPTDLYWFVKEVNKEWLQQKQKEIGDNDEIRAEDFIKELLEELEAQKKG